MELASELMNLGRKNKSWFGTKCTPALVSMLAGYIGVSPASAQLVGHDPSKRATIPVFDPWPLVVDSDLVVRSVDASAVTGNWQTLQIAGIVNVGIGNFGSGPSDPCIVTLFEDGDGSGTLTAGDTVLGSGPVPIVASGGTTSVNVAVAGSVRFRNNRIHAFVDSTNVVIETNETNNYGDTGLGCLQLPPTPNFDPVIKWSWTSTSVLPTELNTMMTPCVGDVTGPGGLPDGFPDIIFASTADASGGQNITGVLRILDGRNGALLVTNTTDRIVAPCHPAIGDLDLDGIPEIIAVAANLQLIVFNNNGVVRWRSTIAAGTSGYGGISLADLDPPGVDPRPEILCGRRVFNFDGTLRWDGTGGTGGQGLGGLSYAADLDLDGRPEVVAGNTIYSSTGAIRATLAMVGDGYSAAGNFDADPQGELVTVNNGGVWLHNHDGTRIWGPIAIPGGGSGGPPTIADFNGDGLRDIGVAGSTRYCVFDRTGALLWQRTIRDTSSNRTGSSVFDFEGDGRADVVYRDEVRLFAFDGATGADKFPGIPMSSCTWSEYVLVADVDADGHADIVATANNNCGFGPQRGLYVIQNRNNDWVGTRRVWNQHAYAITNINDDLSVPPGGTMNTNWLFPAARPHNNFRQNLPGTGLDPLASPDLTSSFIRFVCNGPDTTITARIGNGGPITTGTNAAVVAFYHGDPMAGGTLLGTQPVGAISPGEFRDISLTVNQPITMRVFVVADPGAAIAECSETNNSHDASPAAGVGALIDIQPNRSNQVFLDRNYTIYVAVLGSATLNVQDISDASVRFGATGNEAAPVRAKVVHDVNNDGRPDAVYGFLTFDCGFTPVSTTGTLTFLTTNCGGGIATDTVLVR